MFAALLLKKQTIQTQLVDKTPNDEFYKFRIEDLDLSTPPSPLIDHHETPENFESIVNFCRIMQTNRSTWSHQTNTCIKSFYKNCSFLDFYKEKLDPHVYNKFQQYLKVEYLKKGTKIYETKNDEKDFVINLYGVIRPEPAEVNLGIPITKNIKRTESRNRAQGHWKNQSRMSSIKNISINSNPNSPKASYNLSNSNRNIPKAEFSKMITNRLLSPSMTMRPMTQSHDSEHDLEMENGADDTQNRLPLFLQAKDDESLMDQIPSPCVLNSHVNLKFLSKEKNYQFTCETDCIQLKMYHREFKTIFAFEVDKNREHKFNLLMQTPLFRNLPEQVLRDLVKNQLEEKDIVYRSKLFDYNQVIDYIYIIKEGEFEMSVDITMLDIDIINKINKRAMNPKKEFLITGRKNLVNKDEKCIVKFKLTAKEIIGDFECAMKLMRRTSKAVCISRKAVVYKIKIKGLNYLLLANLMEMNHAKSQIYFKTIKEQKETIKKFLANFDGRKGDEEGDSIYNRKLDTNQPDGRTKIVKVPKQNIHQSSSKSNKKKSLDEKDNEPSNLVAEESSKLKIEKNSYVGLQDTIYYDSLLASHWVSSLNRKNSKDGGKYIDEATLAIEKKNPAQNWIKKKRDRVMGVVNINFDTAFDQQEQEKNVNNKLQYDLKKVDLKHLFQFNRIPSRTINALEKNNSQMMKDLLTDTKNCKNYFYFDNDVNTLMNVFTDETENSTKKLPKLPDNCFGDYDSGKSELQYPQSILREETLVDTLNHDSSYISNICLNKVRKKLIPLNTKCQKFFNRGQSDTRNLDGYTILPEQFNNEISSIGEIKNLQSNRERIDRFIQNCKRPRSQITGTGTLTNKNQKTKDFDAVTQKTEFGEESQLTGRVIKNQNQDCMPSNVNKVQSVSGINLANGYEQTVSMPKQETPIAMRNLLKINLTKTANTKLKESNNAISIKIETPKKPKENLARNCLSEENSKSKNEVFFTQNFETSHVSPKKVSEHKRSQNRLDNIKDLSVLSLNIEAPQLETGRNKENLKIIEESFDGKLTERDKKQNSKIVKGFTIDFGNKRNNVESESSFTYSRVNNSNYCATGKDLFENSSVSMVKGGGLGVKIKKSLNKIDSRVDIEDLGLGGIGPWSRFKKG